MTPEDHEAAFAVWRDYTNGIALRVVGIAAELRPKSPKAAEAVDALVAWLRGLRGPSEPHPTIVRFVRERDEAAAVLALFVERLGVAPTADAPVEAALLRLEALQRAAEAVIERAEGVRAALDATKARARERALQRAAEAVIERAEGDHGHDPLPWDIVEALCAVLPTKEKP